MRHSVGLVADAHFENPRLARAYDPLHPDRSDLGAYLDLVDEFGARDILDVGCGTGVFACMLARRGLAVVGLDPATASLDVARTKRNASGVRWIRGDIGALPSVIQVDLATMTGNVAQVFVTDEEWAATLDGIRRALRPGGRVVFESRVLEDQAWRGWTRDRSYTRTVVPGDGPVEYWVEVTAVQQRLVSFCSTFVFGRDGTVLTSDSTLRFRSREELIGSLAQAELVVREVRDAPDRPGGEFVFIAQRPDA